MSRNCLLIIKWNIITVITVETESSPSISIQVNVTVSFELDTS